MRSSSTDLTSTSPVFLMESLEELAWDSSQVGGAADMTTGRNISLVTSMSTLGLYFKHSRA